MKRLSIFFFSMSLLAGIAQADNHRSPVLNLIENNMSWYYANYTYIESTLKNGSDDSVTPIINMLGVIWQHRDGAIGSEVADGIAIALIHHPERMLTWFAVHPDQYEAFLARLPYALFTDYAGGQRQKKLEQIKLELIESLRRYKPGDDLAEYAERLLAKVEETPIRQIE